MPEKSRDKLQLFKIAVQRIVSKAQEDGVITKEEEEIINITKQKLEEFEIMLQKALEDSIITQEERNQLIHLEELLMSDTYFKAVEDTVIDKDELALLKTLYHTIAPRQSLSWLDEDVKE